MPGQEWYYIHGPQREQVGPLTSDELRRHAAAARLGPQDLVWREGMAQWSPASSVRGLFPAAAAAAAPGSPGAGGTSSAKPGPAGAKPGASAVPAQAQPAPAASPAPEPDVATPPAGGADVIGYYGSGGAMPPRAAANLKGHAPPTGDTSEWPLDDARVEQFNHSVRVRKRVTAAAGLYRFLLLITAIGAALFLVLTLYVMTGPRGSRSPELTPFAIGLVFAVGLCVLYYCTSVGTMRAQRWAPLTMFILFAIGIALNLISIALSVAATVGPGQPESLMVAVFGMILPVIFAIVSWRSYASIPEWRAQPAWCQELIVKAGI